MNALYERFAEIDAYFEPRGATMGASFIAWLLGATSVNPLPPHYYCPQCKRMEFVSGIECGIDLPDKVCDCGSAYDKDGFDISEINIFPLYNSNEIYVSVKKFPLPQAGSRNFKEANLL